MNNKTKGLILSCSDYRENDVLLNVITKEYGIITLVAKGTQKMTSHHHFMPLCHYEFVIDYKDNKTIFTPRSFKLIKSYYDDDIKMNTFKSIFTQALIKDKEDINSEDYDNILFIFENINQNNMYLLGSLFISYLLKKNGLSPFVDGCVVCNQKKIIGLSFKDGGFVCKNHAIESDIVGVDELRKFRLIAKANKDNYELIKETIDLNVFDLFMNFYLKNNEIKLDIYNFFKML